MPYYDETTGLWYDEEGNVVPAPTEGGTQRGAGTYGASGAPTTIDPGTGDITWNIPAPGRTERFQGDIQDLGYQLAISGASLEQAEQQLGERFDAGEYFRQINLYRNTMWAMEHGDRYLGGRQLPGALADVPAFTEALQQQPRGAEGLQAAIQEPTAPTPTDQQQQLGVPDQEGTVPFNPQAEANRLEYNRRLAARPDLQTQGYQPIPENYDISQQGFMQAAPEMAAPTGAPTEAGVTEAERYYPSELEFGLTVDQEYTRMNSADPNRWPVNNAENRARLQRQAMANVLQQYGFSSLEEMMAGAPAPPDTFDFDQAMGMMEGFMDYGPDFMDLFATLPEGAGIAEGMSSEMEWWEGLTPEEQDQWMSMVTGGAPEAEEEALRYIGGVGPGGFAVYNEVTGELDWILSPEEEGIQTGEIAVPEEGLGTLGINYGAENLVGTGQTVFGAGGWGNYTAENITQLPMEMNGVQLDATNGRIHQAMIPAFQSLTSKLRSEMGVVGILGLDGQVGSESAPRRINWSSDPADPLSAHQFGLAMDMYGFELLNGETVYVTDWDTDPRVRQIFNTILNNRPPGSTLLGPDYNAAHGDHLHFNLGYTQDGQALGFEEVPEGPAVGGPTTAQKNEWLEVLTQEEFDYWYGQAGGVSPTGEGGLFDDEGRYQPFGDLSPERMHSRMYAIAHPEEQPAVTTGMPVSPDETLHQIAQALVSGEFPDWYWELSETDKNEIVQEAQQYIPLYLNEGT